LKIEFTPQAVRDLEDIRDWIGDGDPATADRIVSRIRQTIMMFEDFPMMGHDGSVVGTREFKVTGLPYLIVYAINSETSLDIVTVIHSRRNYPDR
jgi:toxin ParE1/3/4